MKFRCARGVALVSLAVLAACAPQDQPTLRPAQPPPDVSGPLAPRVLHAGNHEVVVLDVPSLGPANLVTTQRCYVWRDTEFRTAAVSCPSEDTGVVLP